MLHLKLLPHLELLFQYLVLQEGFVLTHPPFHLAVLPGFLLRFKAIQ